MFDIFKYPDQSQTLIFHCDRNHPFGHILAKTYDVDPESVLFLMVSLDFLHSNLGLS